MKPRRLARLQGSVEKKYSILENLDTAGEELKAQKALPKLKKAMDRLQRYKQKNK